MKEIYTNGLSELFNYPVTWVIYILLIILALIVNKYYK